MIDVQVSFLNGDCFSERMAPDSRILDVKLSIEKSLGILGVLRGHLFLGTLRPFFLVFRISGEQKSTHGHLRHCSS